MKPKQLTENKISKIRLNPEKYIWYDISLNYILSEDFMREFKDYLEWDIVCDKQYLSEEFITELLIDSDYTSKYIHWIGIFYKKTNFSEDFLRKYAYLFNNKYIWINLSRHPLSETFITDYSKQISWINICYAVDFDKISEIFLRKFQYKIRSTFVNFVNNTGFQSLKEEYIKFHQALKKYKINVKPKYLS